jgi:splicing factor 3B subunit 2
MPIPEGAQWGFHPGGWGKPPMDEFNRPLYGDVFGTAQQDMRPYDAPVVDKTPWGELEEAEVESSEEEAPEEEEEEKMAAQVGEDDTPTEGLVTPGGLSSVATGLETPDFIELRKETLYHVLPEKHVKSAGMMGSQHKYDLTAIKRKTEDVHVSINPDDLEQGLDKETLRRTYDHQRQSIVPVQEDFSDMVADHVAKQDQKRQKTKEKPQSKKPSQYKF